jgi:23S rRNA (cytidine2498-2'-O)-methyltransferase
MPSPSTAFLFAITNAGSEKPLKLEVEARGLGWRPSYQRRGFATYKAPLDDQTFTFDQLEVALAFSRRLCLSVGKFSTKPEARQALQETGAELVHEIRWFEKHFHHAEDAQPWLMPSQGQILGTVVEISPTEFWAGLHRHGALQSPYPGGNSGLVMPTQSPSRAWLKLEEAVRFFGLPFYPRDIVIEVGCAPGGVLLALLDRGISVIGVDPAKLADILAKSTVPELPTGPSPNPWLYHCRKPAALVGKRDLAAPVTWFMSDMNQAPAIAIKECGRMIKMCGTIRNALITLKLKDLAEVADRDAWFAELRAMGFQEIRLQQLEVHHHELVLLAQQRR